MTADADARSRPLYLAPKVPTCPDGQHPQGVEHTNPAFLRALAVGYSPHGKHSSEYPARGESAPFT